MSYIYFEDKLSKLKTVEITKRQLIITAYSFQIFLYKIINSKNKNNYKFILPKKLVLNRDTTKRKINYVKPINRLKSVVSSKFCISLNKMQPKLNYIICRFKSEKMGLEQNNNKILKQLVSLNYNQTTKKYHKLIDLILDKNFLKICYFSIKLNSRNFILSTYNENETSDNIKLKWFQKILNETKNGTYHPKSKRLVVIQKKGKKEKKYLIISSFRDKVIQESFKNVLLTIYEPLFSNYFYGLRESKSIHNAIRHLKNWKDASWFVCLSIEKCFDRTNEKKLIAILKQKINDQKFLEIINKFCKAKIVDITMKPNKLTENVFQGNVLSLLLSNVYLNEFDKFMENLMFKLNKGTFKKSIIDENFKGLKIKSLSKKNRQLKIIQNEKTIKSGFKNFRPKRVKYARYAGNFVIGISGDKNLAKQAFNKAKFFLKTELCLNVLQEKSNLITAVHKQAFFLGFFFKKSQKLLNPAISQNLKKKIKHKFVKVEQCQLKKIKSHLKRVISKSLSKHQQFENVDSHLINKVSKTVTNKSSLDFFFAKLFFPDLTIKTKILESFANDSNIFKNFISFQEAVGYKFKFLNANAFFVEINDKLNKEKKGVVSQADFFIQIYAPADTIKHRLKYKGVISKKGKPLAFNFMTQESDKTIITWYASLARSLLTYYSCVNNFYKIKSIVNYQIKWSMYNTLAKKHKISLRRLLFSYGQEFERKAELYNIFPLKSYVATIKKSFLLKMWPY